MRKKDRVGVERAKMFKAVRTAIRLKHSIAADEEINETLPRLEQEFDKAVSSGRAFELDVSSVFEETK